MSKQRPSRDCLNYLKRITDEIGWTLLSVQLTQASFNTKVGQYNATGNLCNVCYMYYLKV